MLKIINSVRKIVLRRNEANRGSMEEKIRTDKQERKRSRVKLYFLQAAKEIIALEGVDGVTVRKVADVAGYSYPTLYSYFEDLNELLWETKRYMVLELVEVFQEKFQPTLREMDIKDVFKTYMEYYLENPNVFKFFYFFQIQRPRQVSIDAIAEPDIGAMWNETLQGYVKSGRLRAADIEAVAKTCIYAIHGLLTLSFSNNGDLGDTKNLFRDLDQIVDYLLKI